MEDKSWKNEIDMQSRVKPAGRDSGDGSLVPWIALLVVVVAIVLALVR